MNPLPPASLARGYLVRGVLLWGIIHLGAAYLGILLLSPPQVVFVVALVFLAARIDDRARHDDVFLGNLGVSPAAAASLSATAALVVEAGVQAVARLA